MDKPTIAITMGEPAGIGPEICCKALQSPRVWDVCRPIIFGDTRVIRRDRAMLKLPANVRTISREILPDLRSLEVSHGEIPVLDFANVDPERITYGEDSEIGGKASGEYIETAIRFAKDGRVDANVTAPIGKLSFKMGGWGLKYPGHTEMYADLTDTPEFTMLLAHGNIRVVHVTTHVSLREAIDLIAHERVAQTIELANEACRMLGIERPRIAVCGLNPHAGEGGTMGREEIEEIRPAVQEAKLRGLMADGPFPADTIWSKVAAGRYDIAVAMYHDQGGIPVKLSGMTGNETGGMGSVRGINVTVGIPIVRVSVDHGTAYDIAGQGVASEESLIEAIENRRPNRQRAARNEISATEGRIP